MTRLPVRLWGDPVLRAVAQPVGPVTDDIRRLAADMVETMYDAPGRGLAAPQVGVSRRLFVMDAHWKEAGDRDPLVLIDPEILAASDESSEFEEGCLSIPGVPVPVSRPAGVTLRWRDLDGATHERRMTGIEAVCAQHEYDHLDGILIPDRADADLRATIAVDLAEIADRQARGETA